MKYDDFFAPKLKQYSTFTDFMKKNLDHKEEEQKKADLLKSSTDDSGRLLEEVATEDKLEKDEKVEEPSIFKGVRLLEAKEDPNKPKELTKEEKDKNAALNMNPDDIVKMDQFKKFKDRSIYKSGLNAIVKLEDFKKSFSEPGLDLFQTGKESVITMSTYDSVKQEKFKELGKATEGDNPKSPDARTLLGNSSISTVFYVILVLFLKFN
jgi:hypothetical protein